MSLPDDERLVHHRDYPDALDLFGKDLFGLLDRPKAEVAELLGKLAPKSAMSTVKLSVLDFTSMTGEIPDEVHEWPNATLGPNFRHLVLHFFEDRLMGFRWAFPPPAATRKRRPWYRRVFG